MSYTTTDRVTPIRRGPRPPAALDPRVTTAWQTGIAPAPGAAASPLSELDRIERDLEADRILAEGAARVVIAAARQRERDYYLRALDVYAQIDALRGAKRSSSADLSGFPDPRTVLARCSGRSARRTPAAHTHSAACSCAVPAYAKTPQRQPQRQPQRTPPTLPGARTGDPLRDEYRHVSGAILNLQASGYPVPAALVAHRDRLLAAGRARTTTRRW